MTHNALLFSFCQTQIKIRRQTKAVHWPLNIILGGIYVVFVEQEGAAWGQQQELVHEVELTALYLLAEPGVILHDTHNYGKPSLIVIVYMKTYYKLVTT